MATSTIVPSNVGITQPVAYTPLSSSEIRTEFAAIRGEFTHAKTDIENIAVPSGTDNHLARFDGTDAVQDSAVTVDDGGEIYGYGVKLNQQTGTTYTLAASDTGKIVECSNSSGITVTLPNSLSVGWGCTLMQTGAGQVTFSAASGAGFVTYQSKTKTAGQYAAVTIWCYQNSGGSAAQYRIAGTMA